MLYYTDPPFSVICDPLVTKKMEREQDEERKSQDPAEPSRSRYPPVEV